MPWLRIALNPDEKSQYVHLQSREDFRKVVESSGFTVEKFDPDKITISMTAGNIEKNDLPLKNPFCYNYLHLASVIRLFYTKVCKFTKIHVIMYVII